MKKILIFTLITLFLACNQEKDAKTELLLGKWKGVAWNIAGKPSDFDVSQVSFEFKADGTYSASFGEQTENGTFKLKDSKLYTTATGNKIEKMVALPTLTRDSIIMDMNRQGQAETLILVKK